MSYSSVLGKLFCAIIISALSLGACNEKCSDVECPITSCQYLPFQLLRSDGKSILQGPGYPRPFINLEVTGGVPQLPPLFKVNNDFSFVACDGVEYTLNLTKDEKIIITTDFEIYTPTECCPIYAISSIEFNGIQQCSSFEQCATTLEVNYP